VAIRRAARSRGPRRYERGGPDVEFNRFANLSDGLFAIALTLLVVTIGVPAVSDARISHEIEGLLPQIIAFFVSFAVISRYWLAHHQFMSLLTSINERLMWSNLVYLALIAFLPFTTGLLGDHGGVGEVVAIYALNVAVISAMETAMFVVAHRGGMLDKPLPPDVYRYSLLESLLPVAVFLVSIPLAFWHTYLGFACWATLIVLEPIMGRRRPVDADEYLP
jgi:uncharacterized membrane protein